MVRWPYSEPCEGLNPGQLFPLEGAAVILGRHPACDIVLESAAVSRQHARILERRRQLLSSKTCTAATARSSTAGRSSQRQLLAENDEVGICDLLFTFHLGPPEVTLPRRRPVAAT